MKPLPKPLEPRPAKGASDAANVDPDARALEIARLRALVQELTERNAFLLQALTNLQAGVPERKK
jgi:hypothetical protein